MRKMGSSILITCLSDAVGKKLAQRLADEAGLYFAYCKDILEYDLFDSKAMLAKCGASYLRKRERGSISAITQYENSLIYVDYDLYQANEELFKKVHPHIYLHVPKGKLTEKDGLNSVAYMDRDNYLKTRADISVNVDGAGEANFQKLLQEIGKRL